MFRTDCIGYRIMLQAIKLLIHVSNSLKVFPSGISPPIHLYFYCMLRAKCAFVQKTLPLTNFSSIKTPFLYLHVIFPQCFYLCVIQALHINVSMWHIQTAAKELFNWTDLLFLTRELNAQVHIPTLELICSGGIKVGEKPKNHQKSRLC